MPAIVRSTLQGPGRPLDPVVRSQMESRLGHDLSQVRVHTGDQAAKSAQSAGARAYTVGRSIVFGAGEYAPSTVTGRRILTHELAHTVQQGFAAPEGTARLRTEPLPDLESEAHAAALAAESGAAPPVLTQGVEPQLQRWEGDEHIYLGDNGGQKTGRIVLRCHETDARWRKGAISTWPEKWADRYGHFNKQQQDAMVDGLTYGEIVGLAGDLYAVPGNPKGSWEALNNAPLLEILTLLPLVHSDKTTTGQFEKASGGRYLTLAKQNAEHFSTGNPGANNMDVWKTLHMEAISAAEKGDDNRAWGLNAMADHYLTDAFAGGHVRLPRAQTNFLSSRIIHNLDNEHGVVVQNRRGDKPWVAYGDHRLFDEPNLRNQVLALEAVKYSKQDIQEALDAHAQSKPYKLPQTFKAEEVVPNKAIKANWDVSGFRYSTAPSPASVHIFREFGHVAVNEGLFDAVPSMIVSKAQIRQWVLTHHQELGRQPLSERQRWIDSLIGGASREDVQAIKWILQQSTPDQRKALKREFRFRIYSTFYFSELETAFDAP